LCAQGINHVGHGRIGITILFLDRRIPDVKLELGVFAIMLTSLKKKLSQP
jgi:hypothetical protein